MHQPFFFTVSIPDMITCTKADTVLVFVLLWCFMYQDHTSHSMETPCSPGQVTLPTCTEVQSRFRRKISGLKCSMALLFL